jgi:heat shock protein HslJ
MKSPGPFSAVFAAGLLALGLYSCDGTPATGSSNLVGSSSTDSLRGQWYLFALDSTTVLDRSIPLTFGDTAHLYGTDGCNTINGAYFATTTTVRIPGLSSTTENCIDSRYPNVSSQLPIALQSVRTWKVVSGELDLSDSTGAIRLRYKRTASSSIDPGWFHSSQPCTVSVAPANRDSLLGQWYLLAVDASIPSQIVPLLFADTNSLNGSDGCNHISGTWFATDSTIRITGFVQTYMACVDTSTFLPLGLDSRVKEALLAVRTWKVSSGVLYLSDSTGAVRMRYGRNSPIALGPLKDPLDSSATGPVNDTGGLLGSTITN